MPSLAIPTDSLYKFIAIVFTSLVFLLQYGLFKVGGYHKENIFYLGQEQRKQVLREESRKLTSTIWQLENERLSTAQSAAAWGRLLPAVDKTPAQAGERFRVHTKEDQAAKTGLQILEAREQRSKVDDEIAKIPEQLHSSDDFVMEFFLEVAPNWGGVFALQAANAILAAVAMLYGYIMWYRKFQEPSDKLLAQQAGIATKSNPKSIRAGRTYKR